MKVEITALPNYEYEKDEFKAKVDRLSVLHSISREVLLVIGRMFNLLQDMETIKENKDLDLPAMEVMVATFRCDRIATETLSRLNSDEAWLALRKDVEARPAPNFRKNIRSILENTLSSKCSSILLSIRRLYVLHVYALFDAESNCSKALKDTKYCINYTCWNLCCCLWACNRYDKEAIHFKESIRDDKRKELETDALKVLYPAYAAMLRHLRSRALKFFETRMIKMVKRATSDGLDASIDSIVQQAMDKFEKESRGNALFWIAVYFKYL
uniref:Sey1/RHD3-like three-helix bundle domain-containing protein n=1 Tax=Salix viminalis TaxID=40686 RepID=A0A6N2M9S7_SALVM